MLPLRSESVSSVYFKKISTDEFQVEVFWVMTPCSGNVDLWNMVSCHNTTRRHNPEDLDLKNHRRENFKTRTIDEAYKKYFTLCFVCL